ncbi:hypothetical protein EIP75_05575 [Aquabacterium soli]|jgi:hypothetical protein|uniref:Uncharacterized protein n=1 Tax=Aquabacterium soli TaxID=2493092 RepID=A0A3R8TD94_9BURK|nr:hypothetical protein [Aquabacterium soli]RRS05048.1 hypothetical protein EIP75_05575 [Aquabacterium soli]
MECSSCGSSDFYIPAEKSALEIWTCKKCGSENAVHCNYGFDLSKIQLHDSFIGTASIDPGTESLKALFKLKKALAFAERFEPSKLEEQHKAGKQTWNLGYFFDFEVQQAAAECLRAGIHASFDKVD